MGRDEGMLDTTYIFGALLVTANRLDTMLERELKKFGLTGKQWMLAVVVQNLFDGPPTIKQAAAAMGSSHQNVKQMALKLQEKGLMVMEKDGRDGRVTRLRLAKGSEGFWESTRPRGDKFMSAVFRNLNPEDLAGTRRILAGIQENLSSLELAMEVEGIWE